MTNQERALKALKAIAALSDCDTHLACGIASRCISDVEYNPEPESPPNPVNRTYCATYERTHHSNTLSHAFGIEFMECGKETPNHKQALSDIIGEIIETLDRRGAKGRGQEVKITSFTWGEQ